MPIRKTFTEGIQIPFSMDYKMAKSKNEELPDHFHDWYEIIYAYQGKATLFIDQSFYELEQGDLILIPGNTIHRSDVQKDELLLSTALFFDPALLTNSLAHGQNFLHLFHEARQKKEYRYRLSVSHRLKLELLFEEFWQEVDNEQTNQAGAIVLYLHLVLLYLNRFGLKRTSSVRQPDWLKESLRFIEMNLHQPLNLDKLSEQAAVSPTYFSRIFKKSIGLTVSDYLTTKRMISAKERLKETNNTIQSIAESVGYQSMPHFYRTFKKYTSMTPSDYRKQ